MLPHKIQLMREATVRRLKVSAKEEIIGGFILSRKKRTPSHAAKVRCCTPLFLVLSFTLVIVS